MHRDSAPIPQVDSHSDRALISSASRRFLSLGMLLLLLAGIAVLTGVALLPFYNASAEGAHRSVQAMQASPELRVLRATHYWSSALLILAGAAFVVYGLISSSYRRPLGLAWVAGVSMTLLFLLFQLTGHILPWDRHAVCTAGVETGIAENVPVVGSVQARLLRGGETVGPRTLSIWYRAHIALLPVALLGLAGLFLVPLRKAGIRPGIPRALVGGTLAILLLLGVGMAAPLGAPAGPSDYGCFTARPEWYVLPLHSLLTLAQSLGPNLAFIGTVIIPGIVVLGLLALPWLDHRAVEEPPSRRVRGSVAVGGVAMLALVAISAGNMAMPFGPRQDGVAAVASRPTALDTPLDLTLVARGKALFNEHSCISCHTVKGQGGKIGPVLDGTGTRHPDLNWHINHLRAPFRVVAGSTMPDYSHLSEEDLRALSTYLLSLK